MGCAESEFGGTEITVRNTGSGIDDSALEHIFEPFQTSNALVANNHGGAGLDLWICRRIVAPHGGGIDVESMVVQGTKVRVWLPQIVSENDVSLKQEAS